RLHKSHCEKAEELCRCAATAAARHSPSIVSVCRPYTALRHSTEKCYHGPLNRRKSCFVNSNTLCYRPACANAVTSWDRKQRRGTKTKTARGAVFVRHCADRGADARNATPTP